MSILRRIFTKVLFPGIIIGSFFLAQQGGVKASHLDECSGDGTIQFSGAPTNLKQGDQMNFSVGFRWDTGQQKCVSEAVEVRVFFNFGGGGAQSIFSKELGKLNPDQTYSASGTLSYDRALDLLDGKSGGGTLTAEAYILGRVGMGDGDSGHSDTRIETSTAVPFTVFGPESTYACVAGNGRYACSTDGTEAGCKNAPACQPSANPKSGTCVMIAKEQCDAPAPPGGGSPGGNTGSPGGGSQPGRTVTYNFSLTNPLGAEDFLGLINIISVWIFNLTIPVAIIVIIWAGLRFMWARGNEAEVTNAKRMLWYAVIGLTVVFIGRGFVTLVQSIINLGGK